MVSIDKERGRRVLGDDVTTVDYIIDVFHKHRDRFASRYNTTR
jgi:hypothetical protein